MVVMVRRGSSVRVAAEARRQEERSKNSWSFTLTLPLIWEPFT